MSSKVYRTCLKSTILAWCSLSVILPTHLLAETPIQALQETLDRFQPLLHDSALLEDTRKEQVLEIILSRFDVREMSKRILGSYWDQYNEQQDAFVAEFTAFMKRVFLKQFDRIKTLKVACREENIQGSTAKVLTNLSTAGEEFVINFRMHRFDSEWKIYDVTLDNGGFSILKNYRTQMQSLLQFASFEQMMQIIAGKK